jgi:transcriptional regulator with XRE-family HTH domain
MKSSEDLSLETWVTGTWFILPAMTNDRKNNHGLESKEQESFGERLSRLRRMAGYSQRALAEELGISHRMVAYYEGETSRPPANLLPALAKALAVTVDQLLGLNGVSTRKQPRNQRLVRTLLKVERLSPRARRAVLDHINALWANERTVSTGGE